MAAQQAPQSIAAFSAVLNPGADGSAEDQAQNNKKVRLVKGDAVMEFIADTIQSKMGEFG
jgi:hypothetical protein